MKHETGFLLAILLARLSSTKFVDSRYSWSLMKKLSKMGRFSYFIIRKLTISSVCLNNRVNNPMMSNNSRGFVHLHTSVRSHIDNVVSTETSIFSIWRSIHCVYYVNVKRNRKMSNTQNNKRYTELHIIGYTEVTLMHSYHRTKN